MGCFGFQILVQVWDAVRIPVPWPKGGSGQGMVLLSLGVLSDHKSRVAFFPSSFFIPLSIITWVKTSLNPTEVWIETAVLSC